MAEDIIYSKQNGLVKLYKKLTGSKKMRQEEKRYCLEGMRLVFDAIENGVYLESLLFTENYQKTVNDKIKNRSLVKRCRVISDETARYISDVKTSQGIFAIAEALYQSVNMEQILKAKYVLALCEIQDPGNLGTILRSAEAFGFETVILYRCCDIYHPKTVRASMGVLPRLNCYLCKDILDFIDKCHQKKCLTIASCLAPNARAPKDCLLSDRGNLLFIGNEAQGLNTNIIEKCRIRMKIPMRGKAESLNAAVAASVGMYELMMQDFKV